MKKGMGRKKEWDEKRFRDEKMNEIKLGKG
jgi:hypothetical protein